MRKLFYAAAGAAALATTSMANAAITIGATGTDVARLSRKSPDLLSSRWAVPARVGAALFISADTF